MWNVTIVDDNVDMELENARQAGLIQAEQRGAIQADRGVDTGRQRGPIQADRGAETGRQRG